MKPVQCKLWLGLNKETLDQTVQNGTREEMLVPRQSDRASGWHRHRIGIRKSSTERDFVSVNTAGWEEKSSGNAAGKLVFRQSSKLDRA